MADLSHQPAPVQGPQRPAPVRDADDLTHMRQGPLGSMAVVPDDYVGPMPPNAVRETEYRRMESVYGNIDSGQSSMQFDTSSFFKRDGKDLSLLEDPLAYMEAVKNAGDFRSQYMGYIQDLVKTPAGLQLLEQLDGSKHTTTIERGDGVNFVEAEDNTAAHLDEQGLSRGGSKSKVSVDPTLTEWDGEMCGGRKKQPWMENRPQFAFYHELVHAYHNVRGDAANEGHGHAQCVTEYPHELGNWEFQAVGLGPWAGNSVSENTTRAQMGAPLRPTYSGQKYGGADIWAQQRDDEEPSLRSPHR